jgi:hypothetical protein
MNRKLFGLLPFIILNLLIIVFLAWLARPNLTIGGDGFGYYAYFHSIFFDRNLDFSNEYLEFDRVWEAHASGRLTPIGKVANLYSVGPSIAWSPFLLTAHYLPIEQFGNQTNIYNLSGFGWPYDQTIFIATALFLILGLIFVYLLLIRYFSQRTAFFSATAIWLLSPLYFYLIYEPSMSHVLSFFAVSGMIYFYLKDDMRIGRKYLLVGLFLGLSLLMRWQNLVFVIIPILGLLFNRGRFLRDRLIALLICLVTAIIVFIPQLLAWKNNFGSWLVLPQGAEFFNLWPENLFNFLFSGYHGLFFWQPLLLLAFLAFVFYFGKVDLKNWFLLLLALVTAIYVNASVSDWMSGQSFGSRRMDGILVVFAIGLAVIFEWIGLLRFRIIKTSICLFFVLGVGWNILLGLSCARGNLPLNQEVSVRQIADSQYYTFIQIINNKQ